MQRKGTGEEENSVPEFYSGIGEGKFGWRIGYHIHRRSEGSTWKVRLIPYHRSI